MVAALGKKGGRTTKCMSAYCSLELVCGRIQLTTKHVHGAPFHRSFHRHVVVSMTWSMCCHEKNTIVLPALPPTHIFRVDTSFWVYECRLRSFIKEMGMLWRCRRDLGLSRFRLVLVPILDNETNFQPSPPFFSVQWLPSLAGLHRLSSGRCGMFSMHFRLGCHRFLTVHRREELPIHLVTIFLGFFFCMTSVPVCVRTWRHR